MNNAASKSKIPVLRFAPSPNGALHLGHAYSALLNLGMAKAMNGRLLLRIEDIDRQRSTPELETAIYEDLHWLGFEYEKPVLRQSENMEVYRAALTDLVVRGLAYPTDLSRGDLAAIVREYEARGTLWPVDPDGAPIFAREVALGRKLIGALRSYRLDMVKALSVLNARQADELGWFEIADHKAPSSLQWRKADPAAWGDVMIARADAPTSYHLSVVLDDAAQGVTHVVRGKDLQAATSIHVVLQRLLGLPTPVYHHHDLVLNAVDGRKLSKSRGDLSLASLRRRGLSVDEVIAAARP